MPEPSDRTMPAAIAMLTEGRRAELRQEYDRRLAAGEAEAAVVASLAMQWGFAPSYVRILLRR